MLNCFLRSRTGIILNKIKKSKLLLDNLFASKSFKFIKMASTMAIRFDQVRYDIYSDKDGSAPTKWKILSHEQIRKKFNNSFDAYEITLRPPTKIPEFLAPGMQIAVLPANNVEKAKNILKYLDGDVTSPREVQLPECTGYKSANVKLSPVDILVNIIDINRPIERLLSLLANKSKSMISQQNAKIQGYHQILLEYANKGQLELRKITDNYSLEEILKIFPQIVTLEDLINTQPKNANRKYTISDIDHEKQHVKIMFSVTEHTSTARFFNEERDIPKVFNGESTTMLTELIRENNSIVTAYFDIRGFERPDGTASIKHKLPYYLAEQSNRPVILISTGVGIGPHLAWLRDLKRRNKIPNLALMVAGGRYKQDELLRDEIESLLGNQFSKYQFVTSQEEPKQYVQDVLLKSEIVWDLLSTQNATIFLCGTVPMEKSVNNALINMGNQHGVDGDDWFEQLEKNNQLYSSTSNPDRFYRKIKQRL